MKNLFAAILILSILSFQFSELLVYTAFKINQDYIAKNLCVEKDVEDSTCKGCCQLKNKVNEQQEQKKDLPPVQTQKQNINFCTQKSDLNLKIVQNRKVLIHSLQKDYRFQFHYSVFHPPKK